MTYFKHIGQIRIFSRRDLPLQPVVSKIAILAKMVENEVQK
jgi:hypothetical protein